MSTEDEATNTNPAIAVPSLSTQALPYKMWQIKRGLSVLYQVNPTLVANPFPDGDRDGHNESERLSQCSGGGVPVPDSADRDRYHTLLLQPPPPPPEPEAGGELASIPSASPAVRLRVTAAAVTPVDLLYTLQLDLAEMKRRRKDQFVDRLVKMTSTTAEAESEERSLEEVTAQLGWRDGGAADTLSSGGAGDAVTRGLFSRLLFRQGAAPPPAPHPTLSPGPPLLWESFQVRAEQEAAGQENDGRGAKRTSAVFVGGTVGVGVVDALLGSSSVPEKPARRATATTVEGSLPLAQGESESGGVTRLPGATAPPSLSVGDRVLFYTSPAAALRRSAADGPMSSTTAGLLQQHGGCWSGYAVVDPSDGCVVRLTPPGPSTSATPNPFRELSDAEAAAMPYASWTAYVALFDKLRVRQGETLLVVGGVSDAVGFVAAQLAAHFGLVVCATSNLETPPASDHDDNMQEERDQVRILEQRGVHVWRSPAPGAAAPLPGLPTPLHQALKANGAGFDHILLCSTRAAALRPAEAALQQLRYGVCTDCPTSIDLEQQTRASSSSPTGAPVPSTRGETKSQRALTPETRQAQCRQSVVEGLRQFLRRCTKFGTGICTTMVPPPDVLLSLFDQEAQEQQQQDEDDEEEEEQREGMTSSTISGSSSLLRRRELSIHFVLLHSLYLDPLTRPMLREVGERIYQLYLDGAFCLRPLTEEGCDAENNNHRERRVPLTGQSCDTTGSASSTAAVRNNSVLRVFHSDQLCEAILTEAKKQSLVFWSGSSSATTREAPAKEGDQRPVWKPSSPPLFIVLDTTPLATGLERETP